MTIDTAADAQRVVLLDSSAAIALVVRDHEAHQETLGAVRGRRLGLAGHAWFETYSVLTRLPTGLRLTPADAFQLLASNFPASGFLSAPDTATLAEEIARIGIGGGAVYDALVGATAREHGRLLISRDHRARATYEALKVEVEFIS
jgi:predicted nucleic acid-binding protein